ncbi:MAG: lytic transglycosylase domain-containing protein [Bacteroidia bacterium]
MPLQPNKEMIDAVMVSAKKYSVEPALIMAHMKRESDFRPQAVREEPQINDASIGLMQVLVKTARWIMNDSTITRDQLFNIRFNVDVGTRYIAKNMKRYNNDYHKAIAAYNAGSARYKKGTSTFINQPYVDFVYGWYLRYKDVYKENEGGMETALILVAMALLI